MRWVLLHSPLTGPSIWRAVAAEAEARGHDTVVAELPALEGPSPYQRIGLHVAAQIGEGPAILVAHSGAGALADIVAAASAGAVEQIAYVDAILPHPGRSWADTAADALLDRLRSDAADGCAPAWDRWFPEGALGALIPQAGPREDVIGELQPTPLSFLEARAPDIAPSEPVAWTYLRLSRAYESQARAARREGRPTLRRDLHHLSPLTHPKAVTSSLENLMRGAR